MNRVAKKRILIVLAVSGVLVAGTGGLYGWRKHRIAAHFAELRVEGLAAASGGDYPVAVNDLRQYLSRYMDDAPVLAEYCRVRPKVISADRSHLRETMQALRYYVTLRPDAVQQRRELLDLYLTYNLNTEALDTAERLLAANAGDAELLAAKTKALARLRRTREASAAAEQWAAAAPDDFQAQQALGELRKATGTPVADILKDADALVAAHPNSMGMRVVRAQALLQSNRLQDAIATLKDAAKLAGPSAAELRALATTMDNVGLFDESVALLTQLAALPSVDAEVARQNHQTLARRLWERGDNPGFLAFVDQHPDVLDGQPDLLAVHGLVLKAAGKVEAGNADLAKLQADVSSTVAKAWSAVVSNAGDASTVEGAKRQVELLNDALIDRPNDPYLLYFMGEAYARTGDQELAVGVLQRASSAAPAWAVPPMRASTLLATQNRFEEAYNLAAMAAARSQRIALPNYIQIWTAAVESGQRNDGAKLLELIDQAIAQTQGQSWLLAARATVLCRLGRTEEARDQIDAELKDPKAGFDQQSLLRLAALSRINKLNLDEAIDAKLRTDFGVNADAAMTTFFRVFLSQGKDAGLMGFEKTRQTAATPDAKDWMLDDARIRDFVRDPKAIESWKALLASCGDDLEVIRAAVASSSLWTDRATMDRLIEQLSTLGGERGMSWRLLRARWLIEGSADETPDLPATQRASDLLTVVLLATPENVSARFWQARAQVRLGNQGAAIENLLAATRLAPRSAPIALYTARLLQEQGDFVRAHEQLDRLTAQDLNDPEQNALAAQLLAQQGKAQEAIGLLEESRSLGMNDESDLLLALLYQRQGAYEKAEAIVGRLMQHPKLSTITFAADFYQSRGKLDVAEQTLQKLYSLQLAPGVREMKLADFNLHSGKLAEARKFGEAATVATPQNVAAWRGLLLAEIADGDADAATATIVTARKALSSDTYLADLQSPAVWPLITQVKDPLFRPLALRLVADPKQDPIRQALAAIKEVDGRETPTLADNLYELATQNPRIEALQIVAAQLLLNVGKNENAALLATKGVQTFPIDEALPRLAAQALLNAGQWSQARSFARVWRQQSGGDTLPADLLAALAALRMGGPADAESLLRPHVSYAMDRLEQHGDVIRSFATALYLQAKTVEGQKVIDEAIGRRPAFAGEWLASAAAELPTSDAIAWFQKVNPSLADAEGKTLAVRVLLQLSLRPDAPAGLLAQLKGRIATMEEQADLNEAELTTLGVVADQIDADDVAERLYRRAIADGKPHPIVWNNLAMLLLSQNKASGEAETFAGKAVEAEPETAVFRDTYAQVLLAAGRLDAARAAIEPAMKSEQQNWMWKLTACEVAAAAGRADDAKALLGDVVAATAGRQVLAEADQKRLDKLRAKLDRGSTTTGSTAG